MQQLQQRLLQTEEALRNKTLELAELESELRGNAHKLAAAEQLLMDPPRRGRRHRARRQREARWARARAPRARRHRARARRQWEPRARVPEIAGENWG